MPLDAGTWAPVVQQRQQDTPPNGPLNTPLRQNHAAYEGDVDKPIVIITYR